MKKTTRSNRKKTGSFEASGSSTTSVRAATITIVVLHLAFILGVFSQGCKKDDFTDNTNKPEEGDQNVNGPASSYPDIPNISEGGNPNAILTGNSDGSNSAANTNATDVADTSPLVENPLRLDEIESTPSGNSSAETNALETLSPETSDSGSSTNINRPDIPGVGAPETPFNGAGGNENEEDTNQSSDVQDDSIEVVEVTIQKNDNLGKIAKRYNTTVSAIMELNADKISNPGKIAIGWVIKVPNGSVTQDEDTSSNDDESTNSEYESYVVQKKDTFSSIGRKFGVSYKEIQKLNNMTTDKIFPGQKLLIPKKKE